MVSLVLVLLYVKGCDLLGEDATSIVFNQGGINVIE